MELNLFLAVLIFTTLAVVYVFYIRPLLKTNPSLGYLYADEEQFWRAVGAKFDGLKQRITAAILSAAAFVVMVYDFIAPYFASAGVDVTQLGIAKKVPPDLWPFIGIAVVILLNYFRHLGDKSTAAKLEAGEAVSLASGVTLVPSAPVEVITPDTPSPV